MNADPDPATQINADPCGSGSGSETLAFFTTSQPAGTCPVGIGLPMTSMSVICTLKTSATIGGCLAGNTWLPASPSDQRMSGR